jgi:cysteine-rich repeat protein
MSRLLSIVSLLFILTIWSSVYASQLCGNWIIENPSWEFTAWMENPHELCDDWNLIDGDWCNDLCELEISQSVCSDLKLFDYDWDSVLSDEDLRHLYQLTTAETLGYCDGLDTQFCCPQWTLCSTSCNDDSLTRFDVLQVISIIRGENELRTDNTCNWEITFCPTQTQECADYDAFDYNNDWQVDDLDVTYIRNAWRRRSQLTSVCDGTVLESEFGGEFCCPEGKVCDVYCSNRWFSKWVIHQNIDSYALRKAIRNKRLPTSCQDDLVVCEETSYPEVEFIRPRGTWRVIAIRY